jgi:hypothetical protein
VALFPVEKIKECSGKSKEFRDSYKKIYGNPGMFPRISGIPMKVHGMETSIDFKGTEAAKVAFSGGTNDEFARKLDTFAKEKGAD